MSDKRIRCKVCNSKKRSLIDSKIRNGDSVNSIAKIYGLSRNTVTKHKNECMVALLAEDKDMKDALVGDSLLKEIKSDISYIHKLVEACDQWLTDPDDPNKYFIGARSDEVEIVYLEKDEETGRTSKIQRKATLQQLLDSIYTDDHYVVMNVQSKFSDPRELLLKSIGKLEGTVKMLQETSQRMIDNEQKNRAMAKLESQGGIVSFEKQVKEITERVTVAFEKSNTVELSELAGLPKLDGRL